MHVCLVMGVSTQSSLTRLMMLPKEGGGEAPGPAFLIIPCPRHITVAVCLRVGAHLCTTAVTCVHDDGFGFVQCSIFLIARLVMVAHVFCHKHMPGAAPQCDAF